MKIEGRGNDHQLKRNQLVSGQVYSTPSDEFHIKLASTKVNQPVTLVNLRTGIAWEPNDVKTFRLMPDAKLVL